MKLSDFNPGSLLVDIAHATVRKIRNRPKAVAKRAQKAAKKAAKQEPADELLEDFNSTDDEVSMNQQVITQILLGIVRHAMTATGVGVYFSDDIVVQAVSALVALGGAFWMARRKVKPAE